MATRSAEDIVVYRQLVREYLDQVDNPEPTAALSYVAEHLENITPPHLSTVTRLMKNLGWRSKRWAWQHNNGHKDA